MYHDKNDNLLASIVGFIMGLGSMLWQNMDNIILAIFIAIVSALFSVLTKDLYNYVKRRWFKCEK